MGSRAQKHTNLVSTFEVQDVSVGMDQSESNYDKGRGKIRGLLASKSSQ